MSTAFEGDWCASLVHSSPDAIVGLDKSGAIVSFNPASEVLFGYRASDVLGRPGTTLIAGRWHAQYEHAQARALSGEAAEPFVTDVLRPDGGASHVTMQLTPVHDRCGRIIGVAHTSRDTAECRRWDPELRGLADHDGLTGVLNRRRFLEEVTRHVTYARRYEPERLGAVLVADVDNLKQVNDAVGHHAGDELLRAIVRAWRSRLRESDIVARLGGDEFAFLLPHADLAEAEIVGEDLHRAVAGAEILLGGRRVHSTVSIGVAPINAQGIAQDELRVADAALYDAKRSGRNRVASLTHEEFARRGHGPSTDADLVTCLRRAVSEDLFELHAQPIVALAADGPPRHELLLRMSLNGTLLTPATFLTSAERAGLIGTIDRWVLKRALDLLSADPAGRDAYHVNLSGDSIVNGGVLDQLAAELSRRAVDPARVTFEISERAALLDLDSLHRFACAARDLGCTVAVDDFGSGFGSFGYLRHVPVHFIKVDGDLVRAMADSRADRLLVKAIVDVAHGLGAGVIAEHVESERSEALLLEYGADYAQGHRLGVPRPLLG